MDRSKMLIQQLALAASRGEDNSVLLALVEEIRNALTQPVQAAPAVENISVIMPAGAMPRETSAPVTKAAEGSSRRPALSVPRPPVVVTVEEEKEPACSGVIPQPAQQADAGPTAAFSVLKYKEHNNEDLSDALAAGTAHEEVSAWMPRITEELPAAPAPAPDNRESAPTPQARIFAGVAPATEPLNLELPLTPEMIAEAAALELAAAGPDAEGAAVPAQAVLSPQQPAAEDTAPQDLNAKMAQRNKMLNEVLARQEPDLAAVLATPRIADLRKAISINEKYQFINTLFRGDEDMFERSIKTLNNFQVMQEANYWMQRELLIKLGWNDEDELVQRFFELVSRRFS